VQGYRYELQDFRRFGRCHAARICVDYVLKKMARHHNVNRGAIMLLENNPAGPAGAGTGAGTNFQNNWNVSY
jgi:hypothetical protein